MTTDNPAKRHTCAGTFVALCIAGCALRLLVWWINPFPGKLTEDAAQYHNLARNMAWEGIYSTDETPPLRPSARRTPGYPGFLAGLYWAFGNPDYRAAELVQVVLGGVACGMAYVLALSVAKDRRVAITTGLLVVMSPPLALHCNHIVLEAVFPGLLVCAMWASYRWLDKQTGGWAVVSGALWGSLALVKPESLFLPVGIVLAVMATSGLQLRTLGVACLGVLAAALVVAPWIIRNKAVLGKASIQFGRADEGGGDGVGFFRMYRLYAENGFSFWPRRFPWVYGEDWKEREAAYQIAMDGPVQDPSESDLVFWLKRPHLVAKYSGVRFVGLMLPRSWSQTFGLDQDFGELAGGRGLLLLAAKGGLLLFDVGSLVFCGIGLLYSARPRNKRLWIIAATILYFVVVYSLLHGIARYRVPLLPLGYLLGSCWLFDWWDRRRGQISTPAMSN